MVGNMIVTLDNKIMSELCLDKQGKGDRFKDYNCYGL